MSAGLTLAFPRLNERGSIEARSGRFRSGKRLSAFPRLNERGSIEADCSTGGK